MAVSLLLEKESLHKKKCHRGICGEEHCQLVSLDQRGGGGKLEWRLLSDVLRFPSESNLKIFGEKIVHWNFFLPKYIKHNILHGGNSAIISFMPVDNVTACQSWSYLHSLKWSFLLKGDT